MVAVSPDASNAALLRRRLARDLTEAGVRDTQTEDACLVLAELVGNAVRHGAPLAGGGLDVAWTVADGVVEVSVTDGGAGVPQQQTSFSMAESGRGLAIVDAVAVSWGVARPQADGTMVWARVSRERLRADPLVIISAVWRDLVDMRPDRRAPVGLR